jgi:hypothetical protein
LLGLVLHLLKWSTVSILPYKVAGWIIVGVLVLMLFLSWVRRPLSAYVIAVFVSLLPATFLVAMRLIVLTSVSVWEFILVGGGFMLLPITLSIQLVRDRATRDYFRFPNRPVKKDRNLRSPKTLWLLLLLLLGIEFMLVSGFTANTLIYDTSYIKAYSKRHYEPSDTSENALMERAKRARIRMVVVDGILFVGIVINTVMIIKVGAQLFRDVKRRRSERHRERLFWPTDEAAKNERVS